MEKTSTKSSYEIFKDEMKEAMVTDNDFIEDLWKTLFKILTYHYSKPRTIDTTIDNYIKARKVLTKYSVIIEVESPISKTADIFDDELYQFVITKK